MQCSDYSVIYVEFHVAQKQYKHGASLVSATPDFFPHLRDTKIRVTVEEHVLSTKYLLWSLA